MLHAPGPGVRARKHSRALVTCIYLGSAALHVVLASVTGSWVGEPGVEPVAAPSSSSATPEAQRWTRRVPPTHQIQDEDEDEVVVGAPRLRKP